MNLVRQVVRSFSRSSTATTLPTTCLDTNCLDCPNDQGIPEFLLKKVESGSMDGSVKPYEKHVFIRVPMSQWPGHIEDWHPYSSLKLPSGVKVSLYSSHLDEDSSQTVDKTGIIMYPSGKSIQDIPISELAASIDRLLTPSNVPDESPESSIPTVFICTHSRRDKRCGVIGSKIFQEFQRIISELGLQARVYACSHLGGHKFAGILISHSHFNKSNKKGTLVIYPHGIWYGRIQPKYVRQIITETLQNGKIIQDLFRGQVSLNKLDW